MISSEQVKISVDFILKIVPTLRAIELDNVISYIDHELHGSRYNRTESKLTYSIYNIIKEFDIVSIASLKDKILSVVNTENTPQFSEDQDDSKNKQESDDTEVNNDNTTSNWCQNGACRLTRNCSNGVCSISQDNSNSVCPGGVCPLPNNSCPNGLCPGGVCPIPFQTNIQPNIPIFIPVYYQYPLM